MDLPEVNFSNWMLHSRSQVECQQESLQFRRLAVGRKQIHSGTLYGQFRWEEDGEDSMDM